jgi:hypothetical protein
MDDFILSNLNEARNEWCARLINIFTPLIIQGIKSIFNESWAMCVTNNETSKYLMTFQNMLCRIPKWNSNIIEEERKRIVEKSGCNYLEDLITCVHIIQLKMLTSIRVGNRQKKIDITIPKLDNFIHKIYIHTARKLYKMVYLFEKNANPLIIQKNGRDIELIVQDCILNAIRESIPTEAIIRAYLDQSVEQEEEVIIENINEPIMDTKDAVSDSHKSSEGGGSMDSETHTDISQEEIIPNKEEMIPEIVPSIKNINNDAIITRLSFNDIDSVLDENNHESRMEAPKTIEQLEKISMERSMQRKMEEEEDEENDRIKIHTDQFDLSGLDILDMTEPDKSMGEENVSLDFEEIM